MKKLSLLLLPLVLFAFCCAPPKEPVPTLEPVKVEKIEYIHRPPLGVVTILENIYSALDLESLGVDVFISVSEDTYLASVGCYQKVCQVRINLQRMMQWDYLYGESVLVFVLGHELGHIPDAINWDESHQKYTSHELELRADEIGGCALKLLGYPIDAMDDFIFSELEETQSHPGPSARWSALLKGYSCE